MEPPIEMIISGEESPNPSDNGESSDEENHDAAYAMDLLAKGQLAPRALNQLLAQSDMVQSMEIVQHLLAQPSARLRTALMDAIWQVNAHASK